MINKKSYSFLVKMCLFIAVISCNEKSTLVQENAVKSMNAIQLSEWEASNQEALSKHRDLQDFKFDIKYLPSSSDGVNNFSFVMRIQSSENKNIFNSTEKFDTEDSKMMYWTSNVKKLLKLETDKDTALSDLVIYENTGKLRNDLIVNVGFTGNFKNSKWFRFSYNDEYLGLGIINFDLTETILRAPQLEF